MLGSQIIFPSAYRGTAVVAHDGSEDALAALPDRWGHLKPLYLRDLPDETSERLDAYRQLAAVAPADSVLASNSSTLPSEMAEAFGSSSSSRVMCS